MKIGGILMMENVILPSFVRFEAEPFSIGWRELTGVDIEGAEQTIRAAGWSFCFLAGEVEATIFGRDLDKASRSAIKKILSKENPEKFNCFQIACVTSKRSMGIPYVSVSGNWRHIQKNMLLNRTDRLAEWDRAKSLPNVTVTPSV